MDRIPRPRLSDLIEWCLRRFVRYRVEGDSMRPTLMPGDHVLVDPRAYEIHDPRPDDIVVARHPYEDRLMIKRVSDVDENGIMLRGDNPSESTDGRTYGRVPQNGLLGRVACRLS